MTQRNAHLVGSLPGSDAAEAMATAERLLGPRLRSIPDGETGERRDWVLPMIEDLRQHPDLELVHDGDWSDYDKLPRLRVRRGHALYGATIDLGLVEAARTARPIVDRLRSEHDRPDLAFQAGVPGDLDLTLFAFGPAAVLTHRRPFTEALLTSIRGVREATGDDTIFQIEVPAELVLLTKAPRRARSVMAGRFAKGIAGLALASPAGTRFGLHLCLGDMNNRAFGTMDDVSPLVALASAVLDRWPHGRPLEYVHAPFAAADQPATTAAAFYEPLSSLHLPATTRFIAGFAHESQPLAEQRTVQARIEDRLGAAADVSASCGLGRRSVEDGVRVLERTAELLDD